jgi:hypothetical protein
MQYRPADIKQPSMLPNRISPTRGVLLGRHSLHVIIDATSRKLHHAAAVFYPAQLAVSRGIFLAQTATEGTIANAFSMHAH